MWGIDPTATTGRGCALTLPLTHWEFRASWLNPRTGELTELPDPVAGGGEVRFETPSAEDWGLWLRREG